MADFSNTTDYSWSILTAGGGISGFNADNFAIDTEHFQNAINGGAFTLAINGNALELKFTGTSPVPEPASWGLFAGLVAFGAWRRRRRRGGQEGV